MTITDEHFEALSEVREAARDLQLACIEIAGTGTLLHMALDPAIETSLTETDTAYLKKLRVVR